MRTERTAPLVRVGFLVNLLMGLAIVPGAAAQVTVAHDDASSTAYDSGWFNGLASGTGFSNWTLQLPTGATAGVASSSNNDFGTPGLANINTAGRALRLVSDNTSTAADGLRTFSNGAMQVGQVFTIWMDNGNIVSGGAVGFGLQNNANGNNRFEVYFVGGESNYSINELGNGHRDTGLGFTRGGLRIALLLTGTDTYRAHIVRNGASSASLFTGGLAGTASSGIDKLRVFNFKAGSNSFDDAFFTNQFDISNGFVWDGGGSVDDVVRPENWKLDVPPISSDQLTVHFAGTTRLTPSFGSPGPANLNLKTIVFDAGAGPFVLNGSTASAMVTVFDGGIVNNSSSVQTINLRSFVNPVLLQATYDAGSVAGGGLQTGSSGTIDISTNTRTLTWTGANAGTIGALITGAGHLVKTGTGLLHMSSGITHDYSGTTTVAGGTLRVDGTLGPNTVTVPAGAVSVGNGTPDSGVLAGSGVISRAVNINSGGTISPGSGDNGNANTIGELTINTGGLTSGLTTLEGGGAFEVQINRRADAGAPGGPGVEGVNWDKLTLSALTVNATSGNRFVVRVVSLDSTHQPGPVPNWDPNQSQTWRVATVSGTVTGFDPEDFEIDASQFTSHNVTLANFFLWHSGGDINLTYVPEPAGVAAMLLCGLALLRRVR